MSHSYSQNLIHRVYSSMEGRRNLIVPELQPQLWEFKSLIAKREFQVIAAGGIENHARVLLALPPTITLLKPSRISKPIPHAGWENLESISNGRKAVELSASQPFSGADRRTLHPQPGGTSPDENLRAGISIFLRILRR
jgi:hypothetical protein